jgi:hypothetical protein
MKAGVNMVLAGAKEPNFGSEDCCIRRAAEITATYLDLRFNISKN